MELLATIANRDPGDDGLYMTRQPASTIERYLRAARRIHALLDPRHPARPRGLHRPRRGVSRGGCASPTSRWPSTPSGTSREGQVPGQVIGSVDASVVDDVARELSGIVEQGRLPEKLLLVHQFTEGMIANKEQLRRRAGVALTFNVDGYGDRPNKASKYEMFTGERVRFNDGFKLFYEEDTNLMSPASVLALHPPPDVVVYE